VFAIGLSTFPRGKEVENVGRCLSSPTTCYLRHACGKPRSPNRNYDNFADKRGKPFRKRDRIDGSSLLSCLPDTTESRKPSSSEIRKRSNKCVSRGSYRRYRAGGKGKWGWSGRLRDTKLKESGSIQRLSLRQMRASKDDEAKKRGKRENSLLRSSPA